MQLTFFPLIFCSFYCICYFMVLSHTYLFLYDGKLREGIFLLFSVLFHCVCFSPSGAYAHVLMQGVGNFTHELHWVENLTEYRLPGLVCANEWDEKLKLFHNKIWEVKLFIILYHGMCAELIWQQGRKSKLGTSFMLLRLIALVAQGISTKARTSNSAKYAFLWNLSKTEK